jgi:hypothetical protein
MVRIECPWPIQALKYHQVINYPRLVLAASPDCTIESTIVQPKPGMLMTFVHIEVYSWSPSALKRLKHLWLSIRHSLPHIVFAQGDVTDAKWVKFVRQFGFEPVFENCPCSDGELRHIFAHYI